MFWSRTNIGGALEDRQTRRYAMRSTRCALGAVMLAGALAMSACGGSSTSSDSGDVDTNVDGKGRTLTLWHYEDESSAMGVAWAAAIEEFEKETGAKVEFEAKAFEQVRTTASQVLNSDKAPDLMEYNKGNATAGLLASQGLLTNLDGAVEAYQWDDKLAPSLQTTATYDDKGVMGSGGYFGIPNYGEYVEFYYNEDLFEKHGVKVPTTFAELEEAMAAFEAKGITPLAESAAEYPLGQLWYQLAMTKADRDWVTAYQTYTEKVDFTGPEISY
ncbi:putative sugar ABC transporter, substrate-binding protein, partial [Nocardioidaceae bacterium Broad-1]